jgi:hypothetical protein
MKRIRTLAIGALLAGVPIVLSACAIRAQEGLGMEAWGITAVPGIELGHHTLTERPTGCTVILARRREPWAAWTCAGARQDHVRSHFLTL